MRVIIVMALVVMMSSCSLLGQSDYTSHTQARVQFKQSDDARLSAQSQSIADMAAKDSSNAEAAAYKNALGMIAIALLKPQEYSEAPPMTWAQVGGKVVDTIPFVAGMGGMYLLGKEGIKAAGNVEIGANSNVSGSFNKPSLTSVGESTSATLQPYEVRPEIVAPVIVEPGVQ